MTMAATLWLLLAAVAVVSTMADTTGLSEAEGRRSIAMASCTTAFVLSPRTSPSSKLRKSNTSRVLPLPSTTTLSPPVILQSLSSISLAMSIKPSNQQSLQQQILQGATLKLLKKKSSDSLCPPPTIKQISESEETIPEGQYSYYVREGMRSEMNEITDVLMNSFHPQSQSSFDSYIRRYKYNHLKMCFDAIDASDRGLFVACAVPTASSSSSSTMIDDEEEQIVGFCSVDGRAPDPSCKIEFLTPSTLAGTSPRPYLSDLGVATLHRRRGIGEKLVRACEQWTRHRGYENLYLKVEKENVGALNLYCSAMGYSKTKLPWSTGVSNVEGKRWDTTVLLEKYVVKDSTMQSDHGRKRTWIKNQLWKPIKESVDRYSTRENNGLPL